MEEITVSLVVPIRNESKYIDNCVLSIQKQTFDANKTEVIFVDGSSTDDTVKKLEEYKKSSEIKLTILNNSKKIVPTAMNIGIKAAIGKYIVRLDAHSEYPNDYIQKAIDCIENIDADNVGGIAVSDGDGYVGKAFSYVLNSKFGVGNSNFRVGKKNGYVDTVPFGVFKREVFEKYGFYDERLIRNQDIELNSRINKNGGKVYLDCGISLKYKCRDSITGIINQNFENGRWNVITYFLSPGSMSVRHFVPLVFVASVLILSALLFTPFMLFEYVFIAEIILYLSLNLIFSTKIAVKNGIKYFPILLMLFPILHLCYGLGSVFGIINMLKMRRKSNVSI